MLINNKLIHLVGCIISLSLLSGCGSLVRFDSGFERGTYQGVNNDLDLIYAPYAWYFSFGIIPLFATASIPIDAVVDTALFPIDYSVASAKHRQFLKEQKEEQRQKDLFMQEDLKTHVYLKVYAINLTGDKGNDDNADIDEKFKYKPIERIEIKQNPDVLNTYNTESWHFSSQNYLKLTDNGRFMRKWTQDTALEVSWKVRLNYTYADNPHKSFSREWYDWQRDTKKRNQTVKIPNYHEDSSITLIFLPCDQLAISTTLTPSNYQAYLDTPAFKKELAQLNKRQTEYQCAQK